MTPGEVQATKDVWEIVGIVSTGLGVVLVPVVVGLVGHWGSKRIARREIEAETMKLAVAILGANKMDAEVRKWAVEVLDKYSGVPIEDGARASLVSSGLNPSDG